MEQIISSLEFLGRQIPKPHSDFRVVVAVSMNVENVQIASCSDLIIIQSFKGTTPNLDFKVTMGDTIDRWTYCVPRDLFAIATFLVYY